MTRSHRLHRSAPALAALRLSAALAACSSSPPVRHYSLGPLAHSAGDASTAPPDSGAGPSLIVGPVSLPDVIDRPQIVRIVDGVRVEVADTHRWSGNLRNEIARRLATGIAHDRHLGRVVAWPASSVVQPDYTVPVDIQRLETTAFDHVTLEAVWTLRHAGKDVAGGRFVATQKIEGGTYEGLAAAHGRLVDALAREIGGKVGR